MVLYVLRVDGVRVAAILNFAADRGQPQKLGHRAAGMEQERASNASRRRDAEESRMAARTLVLKGHSDPVACLAALDGGRIVKLGNGRKVLRYGKNGLVEISWSMFSGR